MKNKSVYYLTQTAVIAALYAVLTIFQSVIFPESTSAAIQFRVSEALTILALYTNAAIPALTIGCVLANISSVAVLGPLDMIFGSIASLLAALTIYLLRNVRFFRLPIL
ncbi:MAG: QueT transporter family protein [Ruminococcus sp.]|nr:QueT transporter family protein [Ruminococcus sp.]